MVDKKTAQMMVKAKATVQDTDRLKALMNTAREKMEQLGAAEATASLLGGLQMILRMIRAHYQGTYKAFSTATLLLLVFALIYFITPIDLIPDFVPALGLTDDLSVVYFILRQISADLDKFKDWERINKK